MVRSSLAVCWEFLELWGLMMVREILILEAPSPGPSSSSATHGASKEGRRGGKGSHGCLTLFIGLIISTSWGELVKWTPFLALAHVGKH